MSYAATLGGTRMSYAATLGGARMSYAATLGGARRSYAATLTTRSGPADIVCRATAGWDQPKYLLKIFW